MSFAKHFVPWDWVIVTGMYTDDIDAAFYASALRWFAITSRARRARFVGHAAGVTQHQA